MKWFLIIFVLFLLSCGDDKKSLLEDFNKEKQELVITVKAFDNQRALLKAIKSDGFGEKNRLGMTVWNNIDNECVIYVIRPKHQDSARFTTWGHELGHCVYGTFHKE